MRLSMSQNILKQGYIGYDEMGKPIPFPRRRAACEMCKEYGYDAVAAESIVTQIARLLERNKPLEALIVGRRNINITIAGVYRIIAVLMTGDT